MCGIAGVFAYDDEAPPVDLDEVVRIRDAMAARGPDGAGLWTSSDRRTALAHRRLAIIDLTDAGAQPMATADGRLHVTFNGEIYNYRHLRKELEGKGHCFRSGSDTEVLLHLYADRGANMVHALRGMYAFAIWDELASELFLARDPFGIKPLYYSDNGESLRFASQVKALLKGGAVDTAPEPAGSVGFLVWGHVPEPYTLYRGIRSLAAGAYMLVSRRHGQSTSRYFEVGEELRNAEEIGSGRIVSTAFEVLRESVVDSVRHHLVSDVPVGLFLSAGVDSTTLAGLAAAEGGTALRAVTLGFREFQGSESDEVPIAAHVAAHFGIHHEAHWTTREDFQAELGGIIDAMDQPTIDGVNTYFVSRAAARAGMKVALSGVGGDELFGGYPSFVQLPQMTRWLGPARHFPVAGRLVRRALAKIIGGVASPKYASVMEYGGTYEGAYLLRRALFMPWETTAVLDRNTVQAGLAELGLLDTLGGTIRGIRQPRSRVAAMELSWYMRNQLLRDSDWAGMAHSLEVRVPLVDVQLFRAVAPLIVSATPPTKRDFANALQRPLPSTVVMRRKTGFSTPVQDWLLQSTDSKKEGRGLRDWAKRVLPPQARMFKVLALVTDAFGGKGGIAAFNRDLLGSIAAAPDCAGVVAVPRVVSAPHPATPPNIRFVSAAAGGKLRFIRAALAEGLGGHYDLLVVGHINLAPLGALLGLFRRRPSLLLIFGVDAWTPHKSSLVKASIGRFRSIVSISQVTTRRFAAWSGADASLVRLLPCCVDLRRFRPGPKPLHLEERLGLKGRIVVMTLGRLASEERFKGFDEIIEVLPALVKRIPNISYLICGEGSDRSRLESKVQVLGLESRVVFAGFVPEEQKADYYHLADAYVMPSRGEGFGIVFLEALACGLPVLGSVADGSREALLDGALGHLVDPDSPNDVALGVIKTLARGAGQSPSLEYFSQDAFSQRVSAIVHDALASGPANRALRPHGSPTLLN